MGVSNTFILYAFWGEQAANLAFRNCDNCYCDNCDEIPHAPLHKCKLLSCIM